MVRYNPIEVEAKWQKYWEDQAAFRAEDFSDKEKFFTAEMFPYPSGSGLHVGHVRNFTIVDVVARFEALKGKNVLRPFGYDTFGLPAENYAIKTGVSPQSATATNIKNFRHQAKRLGYAIDWSREINSSDPEYYHWTQWIFKKLFESYYDKDQKKALPISELEKIFAKNGNRDLNLAESRSLNFSAEDWLGFDKQKQSKVLDNYRLAYRKESQQWWCSVDKTVLANEQVESGKCWRCGNEVSKKTMKQWFFRITAYADELLEGLEELDWPNKIKVMQRNWIGRSEGAEIDFGIDGSEEKIKVFTTRPDTIFGATYMVLAPEHEIIEKITTEEQKPKVRQYIVETGRKSEIERQENKDKTGVFTGAYAINPANGEKIQIWISDYVLTSYGTGAIMAVPAHDERDFDFAKKFELPIIPVIESGENNSDVITGSGKLINSGDFNGKDNRRAGKEIVAWLEGKSVAKNTIQYKMRDWLISRQRYWGCPIPIAYDENNVPQAIADNNLPVLLPDMNNYKPDDSGRSALARNKDWLNLSLDNTKLERETDTMDGYACSSWYLLRYADPHNSTEAWSQEKANYWNPIDCYVGGDHAVAHLLYVRFWTKFLSDIGYVNFREPIKKLIYHGYVNAPDGRKMSKSKGNVIDPLDIIDNGYGADTLRTYEMFMGSYEQDVAWDIAAVGGVFRFLNRVWNLVQEVEFSDAVDEDLRHAQHYVIKKVTHDLENQGFNTAVAALMEYLNSLTKQDKKPNRENIETLLILLMPFAPHISAELLEQIGWDKSSNIVWPTYNEEYLTSDTMTIVVQVNGKLRAKLNVAVNTSEEDIKKLALADENVQQYVSGEPKKIIYVKNKLISIVA